MAALKTEMPPLLTAEAGGGGGGGGIGSSGAGNSNVNTSSNNGGNAPDASNAGSVDDTTSSNVVCGSGNGSGTNNTVSAAADSSDNQPSTPQPMHNAINVGEQQQQQQQQPQQPQQGYHLYGSVATTNAPVSVSHMYTGLYSNASGQEMQQQPGQHNSYPSYLDSYEQFYQQQQHQQLVSSDYGSNGSLMYSNSNSSNIRFHPYRHVPITNNHNSMDQNEIATSASTVLPVPNNSSTVTTTTHAISPRVVSSTSPTSTSTHMQLSGNSVSPGCNKVQCKKCGTMCSNESELQEHITNIHGASPYSSSGYSSSPYIKDEIASGPPQQAPQQASNPGDILDLDSQKMVYPPSAGNMQVMLHQPHHQLQENVTASDPLHSMHNMQQRALPGWDQPTPSTLQEGLPAYIQQQSSEHNKSVHTSQSPYYSPKQSPYSVASGAGNSAGATMKQDYPLIKSEYADSQNYVDKSFDPTSGVGSELCQQPVASQQAQQIMPISSSPAEFPSTTTGPQEQSTQYRGFEPPTSSSVLPANSITAKAATWKSNEARRPKTYNCTACNKWFTSSGHLKRHYNTTLHKNAVKSSGQPDPATLPISAHHHPAREPGVKHSRRNNAAAAAAAASQQQQPPAPVQPPEPPRSSPDFGHATGLGQMSHYSPSPSPTQQQSVNGMSYGPTANGYQQQQSYIQQATSSTNASPQQPSHSLAGASPNAQTVLNGHPNGLAGPSETTPPPMPSSHTRGLLNKTTTIITKSELMEDNTVISPQHSPMVTAIRTLQEQQQQLEEEAAATAAVVAEQEQLQRHQQMHLEQASEELEAMESAQTQRYRQQSEDLVEHHQQYRSNTPNSTAQSPPTISPQLYQEQQLQMDSSIFSHTPPPPQQAHMPQANIMGAQFSIIPMGMATPPPHSNNMQLLQPPQHTSTAITSMGSIHMLHSHPPQRQAQLTLPPMPSMLHNNISIQSHLDTISITTTPPPQLPITTTLQPLQQLQLQQQPTTTACFQQLQPASELAPLEPTMTPYPITIGNNTNDDSSSNTTPDTMQVDPYANLQQSQILSNTDGPILQYISGTSTLGQSLYTFHNNANISENTHAPISLFTTRCSPTEGDLPPAHTIVPRAVTMHMQTTLQQLHPLPLYGGSSIQTFNEYNNGVKPEPLAPAEVDFQSSPTTDTDDTEKNTAQKRSRRSNNTPRSKRKRSADSTSTVANANLPQTITLPSGRIKCVECNKEFSKNCYLTQHNKSFHSGEYPYRCQKCGKRFQNNDIYVAHLERHKTQDKPHKCDSCPKQFHHKTDLRRHVEAIHTGLKQHVCDICEKSFCRQDHLRKHIETHNRPRVVAKKAGKRAGISNERLLMTYMNNKNSKHKEGALLPDKGLNEAPINDVPVGHAALSVVVKSELISGSDRSDEDESLLVEREQEKYALVKEEVYY